ncbi:geranylgeranylglyceryl/heptaprenylglyceryl phosphate synthase [Planktosalinus lacus]|uniref:Geranylgeranylglyceryl phosphate synthase n=1 Tax=Planktosalinus lacus TaxID=1526573 RepID=A0A8J2Y7D5_9FLAO|nr:geranylgeranylglyceryl/heptaprenylglyceryl phosphate synthase [Planktosalinus lacus]GGD96103.1 geranylgeranylglyceryl phosphate synthase [Planktosalinus lacus]
MSAIYTSFTNAKKKGVKQLAILIDPEDFDPKNTLEFLNKIPKTTTHLFVGGSTATKFQTETIVNIFKQFSKLPVVLFPGDAKQITNKADALLFLSLFSGDNPEYLINQQVKAVKSLQESTMEVIPTAYLLIDGGARSAVERVSNTKPMAQNDIKKIIHTALAGQYSGKKLVYLEAGSGAKNRVSNQIILSVSKALNIPLIVGGGIRSAHELEEVFKMGADIVVIGTAFEQNIFVS